MEASTPTVRIGITCLPIYIWATEENNGTIWHGVSIALLRNMLKYLPVQLAYVQYDYDPTIKVMLEGKFCSSYLDFPFLIFKIVC